jgi:hypothetical protein
MGSVVDVESQGMTLGCKVMSYVGLPLGAHFKARSVWNGIVERMERRLATWKRLYLSKVVNSLFFFFSFFLIT